MLQVKVNNDESDESYDSSWSYMQHITSNALVGHDRRTFHKELTDNKVTTRPDLLHKSFTLHLSVDWRLLRGFSFLNPLDLKTNAAVDHFMIYDLI